MNMSVRDIAELVGGTVVGDGDVRVTGVNGIEEAGQGELTFLGSPRYLSYLETTQAAAILVPQDSDGHATQPTIQVASPYLAFAMVLQRCESETLRHPTGIHPTAAVGEDVTLGENVALDAHVRIADGCRIGDNTVLYAGAYVGRDSAIGPDCVIYPNVVIRERVTIGARCILHSNASIGSDGFGFAPVDGIQAKIPQIGEVEIGDDVEIGANSAVDRATCGQTRIGDGTKIDNQVQIGHNVHVGRNCVISGGTALAGSARIGNNVTVAGQAGIAGHIEVGDNVVVAGRGGVTKSVEPNKTVSGFPAMDHATAKRIQVSQRRLPDALKRIRSLESRIDELEERLNG